MNARTANVDGAGVNEVRRQVGRRSAQVRSRVRVRARDRGVVQCCGTTQSKHVDIKHPQLAMARRAAQASDGTMTASGRRRVLNYGTYPWVMGPSGLGVYQWRC